MRTLVSAAIAALLTLAACEENTPQQEETGVGTEQGGTGGGDQVSGEDSGGVPPPADEPPPSDEPPPADEPPSDAPPPADEPPVQEGGDVPAEEDSAYSLPQAAAATLRYAGPAEDHLHVHAAGYSAVGSEVRSPEDLWRECFEFRLDDRPNWCDGERFRDSWNAIADEINRLDDREYDDRDIFEARAEERFSSENTDYGELLLGMRILTLPSTRERAQVSRFVTTTADWTGYPAFLSVETGLPGGRPSIPAGEFMEGTLIRIYGVDEGGGWDEEWVDNDKHNSWEPRLLMETTLHGNDRYDFRLPPDSPYWDMEGPVRFTIEISQWMTVTRRP